MMSLPKGRRERAFATETEDWTERREREREREKKEKIKGGRKKSNRESVHSCVNYINLMVYRSDPL